MELEFIERIGSGVFGDVYKCKDVALGREVAVKIFRAGGAGVSDALAHARALARNNHKNVVTVHHIDRVKDPCTGEDTDCVVMELIEGVTLEDRLAGPKFTLEELRSLGGQIIDGIEHIHSNGLIHGDFHVANIMINDNQIKIIDILYRGTLAELASPNREEKLRQDLVALRLVLVHLLAHSEIDPGEATAFNQRLLSGVTTFSIREAFLHVSDPTVAGNLDRLLGHAYMHMIDDHFVEGVAYASALADETQQRVVVPLLNPTALGRIPFAAGQLGEFDA